MINGCDGCKFWSEMIAQSTPTGHVAAMCLNPDSPRHGQMAVLRNACKEYMQGVAVDDPQTAQKTPCEP